MINKAIKNDRAKMRFTPTERRGTPQSKDGRTQRLREERTEGRTNEQFIVSINGHTTMDVVESGGGGGVGEEVIVNKSLQVNTKRLRRIMKLKAPLQDSFLKKTW